MSSPLSCSGTTAALIPPQPVPGIPRGEQRQQAPGKRGTSPVKTGVQQAGGRGQPSTPAPAPTPPCWCLRLHQHPAPAPRGCTSTPHRTPAPHSSPHTYAPYLTPCLAAHISPHSSPHCVTRGRAEPTQQDQGVAGIGAGPATGSPLSGGLRPPSNSGWGVTGACATQHPAQ